MVLYITRLLDRIYNVIISIPVVVDPSITLTFEQQKTKTLTVKDKCQSAMEKNNPLSLLFESLSGKPFITQRERETEVKADDLSCLPC